MSDVHITESSEPLSHDDWWASLTDDERDAVVASANTGTADDYSHLDGADDVDE